MFGFFGAQLPMLDNRCINTRDIRYMENRAVSPSSRELQSLGVAALAVRVDVAAREELQPALEKVEETLGPVSILVNNANIAVVGGVLALPSSLMAVTPSGERPPAAKRIEFWPNDRWGEGSTALPGDLLQSPN
jgi:NAD(P)-dependent dehydrogenase (short-subunit alcohol dehydrogenase family)